MLELAGAALAALANENEIGLGAIDQAILLNPNLALAFSHRALVLNRLGRHDEAIGAAERSIRLSPQDPTAYVSYQAIAIAKLAVGQYETALSWAERALRDDAGRPSLNLKLSLCGHLGRPEEARRLLQETEPKPTIVRVRSGWSRNRAGPAQFLDRLLQGMRKAGVAEE